MKINLLIPCLTTGLLMFGQLAQVSGNPPAAHSSHIATFEPRHRAGQTRRPPALSDVTVSGVIPRAIRGGNPLQMLNPFAPARYGTAKENVSFDPDIPGKGNGINLFSISF